MQAKKGLRRFAALAVASCVRAKRASRGGCTFTRAKHPTHPTRLIQGMAPRPPLCLVPTGVREASKSDAAPKRAMDGAQEPPIGERA